MPGSHRKKILFAPLNWGLGHATRILPLIKLLLKQNHLVYVAASGRSRMLLESEVPDCCFLDFPKYPIRYSRSRFFVTRFMFTTFPAMLYAMRKEAGLIKKLHAEYNFNLIISDNRFSARHPNVPSLLISHQLRYKLPWPLGKMEWLPELFNAHYFKKYQKIIVPDIDGLDSYTGELAHQLKYIPKQQLYYAGLLGSVTSDFAQKDDDLLFLPEHEQLDFLIIISGPEPQRSKFEDIIKRQITQIHGRIAVALGVPEKKYKISIGNVTFYTYLNRNEMSRFMRCSNFIITRPGYTTVMEMVELGKHGLFIPTPGQVEQEYLSRYYLQKKWCYSVQQHKLNLSKDLVRAMEFKGLPQAQVSMKDNPNSLYTFVLKKYLKPDA